MGLDGYAKDLVRKKEAIQMEENYGDSLCRKCGKIFESSASQQKSYMKFEVNLDF